MKILILHRIPYYKIEYHRGIDHDRHEVTYVGTPDALSDIPSSLKCHRKTRAGIRQTFEEIAELTDVSYDRILSLSEYELMDAALLRERWGIHGPTPSEVSKVRNKVLMKENISNRGIRVPRFIHCSKINGQIPWIGPTVLKPVDGASSENVTIFPTFQQAVHAIQAKKNLPFYNSEKFELEEFVDGPIIHIDGIIQNSELRCALGSEYVGNCLAYALGQPLGSIQFDLSSRFLEWTEKCLRALNLTNGAFHLEAIVSAGEPVFLEVGNRVGGADVVDTFERATGIHLPSEELKVYTNEKLSEKCQSFWKTRFNFKFGWFVFPGHHLPDGSWSLNGAEEFKYLHDFVKWCQLHESQNLPRKITYQPHEVPLAGIVKGTSANEMRKLLERLFQSVRIQTAKLKLIS